MKRALIVLLLAGAGCATPPAPPVDPLTAQLASTARAAYERRDHRRAAAFYEQALQRAHARDSREEISGLAYNLAACRLLLGQTDGVAALLTEARQERVRAGQRPDDLDLLEANLLRATGKSDEAGAMARRVAEATPTPALALDAWLLVGQVAAEARDAVALEAALAKAGDKAGALADFLRGESRLLRDDAAGAARHFERSADAYRKADRPAEMAESLARSAAAYEMAGQTSPAMDRFYRAARSAHARGDEVSALRFIQRGLAVPPGPDDASRAALLVLFEEIRRAKPPSASVPSAAVQP